jgi:porin
MPGHRSTLALACALLSVVPLGRASAGPADDSDRGYEFFAGYTADLLANIRGGLRTGQAYLDYLEVGGSIDVGQRGGPEGFTAYASGFMTNAARFSERYVGDAMAVSNIENGYALQLLEAWVQWEGGAADRYSARVGLYDLSSEFDSTEARTLFLNSAHGIGHEIAQTGLDGPSIFPSTALAARFAWQPQEAFVLRVAVADAVPGSQPGINGTRLRVSAQEGALLIAQASVSFGPVAELSLGHWGYTRSFEIVPADGAARGERESHNQGTYLNAEFAPRAVAEPAADEVPWRMFARIGYADPDVNEFDLQLAAGASAGLPWPSPNGSEIGLAWLQARLSDRKSALLDAAGLDTGPEQNVELTWRVPIGNHLVLQPDLQYVIDPADDRRARDAWVVGLRLELATAW